MWGGLAAEGAQAGAAHSRRSPFTHSTGSLTLRAPTHTQTSTTGAMPTYASAGSVRQARVWLDGWVAGLLGNDEVYGTFLWPSLMCRERTQGRDDGTLAVGRDLNLSAHERSVP